MPTSAITYALCDAIVGVTPGVVTLAGCPNSVAYFCTTCGEIWFRAHVRCDDGTTSPWFVEMRACEKHLSRFPAEFWGLSGGLLNGRCLKTQQGSMSWATALEHLPRALREREFLLRTTRL